MNSQIAGEIDHITIRQKKKKKKKRKKKEQAESVKMRTRLTKTVFSLRLSALTAAFVSLFFLLRFHSPCEKRETKRTVRIGQNANHFGHNRVFSTLI